ncbi:hypothetical protein [Parafrankia elaeagni]|uniref:hypothetical protein n=1 Tax=Parafrankia elaeagni TaxID=222534 RepID=UPI001E5E6892|nr:hypothetical protein [Parafrankia elaeagni]
MSLTEWAFGRLIIVIVATATVTAIGAGGIGYVAGRHSSDSGPRTPADSDPAPEQSAEDPPETPAVAVSPTSEVPVAASDGPVGGPTRVNEFGVPVGYPHTEAGAISACGNYFTAYNNVTNRAEDRIRGFFGSISDQTSVETLASGILQVDEENAATLGVTSIQDPQVNFDARPLGYQIQSSSESDATIFVWGAISLGVYDSVDPIRQAQVRWGSEICQVRWQEDDWKLIDADDGPDGPLLHSRNAGEFRDFVMAGGPQS